LLKLGEDIDWWNPHGNIALTLAAKNEKPDAFHALLNAGASVNRHSDAGFTALIWPAQAGE
jgi:ankyrin repeat protein